MDRSAGIVLLLLGLGIALVGALIWSGALGWFGRLPGDLRLGGDNARVYIPITSMIIVSIVLTLILSIVGRLR
jgi:di/tricarboxylate transporter